MSLKNKYVCIHGHFYQPPRENAWLEVVELQDSASPFHDWNERINFECYAPNTAARILDDAGRIINIFNNYTRISFNFGPTLLSWLQTTDPETYEAIIASDRQSRERFNGHGSALAQAHSHTIMPLANRRDKETQISWGVRDFALRFGRAPEGLWLPETAVDTETLEILVDHDLKFTILAPRQAKAFRRLDAKEWTPTPNDSIDPRRPYLYRLPSGRSIVLFFYHGGIAQGVAFNGLLNNGKHFAHQFLQTFDPDEQPQLTHIATDGESYGHHHRYGEMALADCLRYLEENGGATLTNYGAFLEQFPPEYEARIHENSSWSCVHGVERWRSDCGCNTGGHPGWNQTWRGPLRDTLNWLRDQLAPLYEREAGALLRDVWAARDAYIDVINDRSLENVRAFLDRHAHRSLNEEEQVKMLRLMELQRNAMLMFTSCGWFFDEISGLETNQILQYANRAIHYADQVAGVNLHDQFVERLKKAPSNVFENGATSYLKNVAPARVDLSRVAMHYAVSSLFEAYPEQLDLFNYHADSEIFLPYEAGNQKLVLGRAAVKSRITHSEKLFSFAVFYFGQQNIIGNISLEMSREVFDEMSARLSQAFLSTNLGEVFGFMQRYFGEEKYSINHLFRDEKRKILHQITEQSLHRAGLYLREIYNDNYQLMTNMLQSDIPIPDAYYSAVQFVINFDLRAFFENGAFQHIRSLRRLADEFKKWTIQISNESSLQFTVSERIYEEIQTISENAPLDMDALNKVNDVLEIIQGLGVAPNVWKSQNLYFSLLKKMRESTLELPTEARDAFYRLGDLLRVKY